MGGHATDRIPFRRLVLGALVASAPLLAGADVRSFDISAYPGISKWNALGLAVDPRNHDVWVSALAYGGEDNLYRFAADGALLGSFRIAYPSGLDYLNGSPIDLEVGNGGVLYSRFAYNPSSGGAYAEEIVTIEAATGQVLAQSGRIDFLSGDNGPKAGFARVGQYSGAPGVFAAITSLDSRLTVFDAGGTTLGVGVFQDDWLASGGYYATNGLAFNSDNTVAYTTYIRLASSGIRTVLASFSQTESGTWTAMDAYDLSEVASSPLALDFDSASQRFYVQENNLWITSFELTDLQAIPTVSEPMTSVLLSLGVALLGLRALQMKHSS